LLTKAEEDYGGILMNRLNKFLKVILATSMLMLQFVVPLSTTVLANDGSDILVIDFDPYDDSDVSYPQDTTVNSVTTGRQPAHTGYIPQMLFADDMLPYINESEIFESVIPAVMPVSRLRMAAPQPLTGLVQLVLEPVGNYSNWPGYICLNFNANGRCATGNANWVSIANARAAAFNAGTIYHRIFTTETGADFVGVNGRYGRDALFLGTSANGLRYRILIAGMIGYVNRVDTLNPRNITVNATRYRANNATSTTFQVRANAQFIPFNQYPNNPTNGGVMSASHYVNRGGHLYRVLTNNVGTAPGSSPFVQFLTGPAPTWMTQNVRYYSFDGVFFYIDPRDIRPDGTGAVNEGNPFFNYFQYLSFRSHSTVTAAQLDSFLTDPTINPRTGYRWHTIPVGNSVMRNQGQAFVNAQSRYGINALLMYAKAMHEGAGGTSSIARNNNNLFGLGAFDATPSQSANWFPSPAASVNSLARGWLSRGYLWHTDWRNAGPHAGHKGSGMNVRYATDPYWGQKIAGWAFRIDSHRPATERDINREQIAIRQETAGVAVQNANGQTLYTANRANFRFFPFLVSGADNNNRLRVVTDTSIVNGVVATPVGCTISAQNTCDGRTNATYNNNLFNRATAVGYIQNSNVWMTGATIPALQPASPGNTTTGNANISTNPGNPGNNNNNQTPNPPPGNNNNNNTQTQNLAGLTEQPSRRVTPVTAMTSGTQLRVRRSPNTSSDANIIDTWPNYRSVTVVGTNANNSWLTVRFNTNGVNSYGWIREDFVAVNTATLTTYTPANNNNNNNNTNNNNNNQTPPPGGPTTNRGWQQSVIANQWYYYGTTGVRQTGWVRSGSHWYFLNPIAGQPGHNTELPVGRMLDGWITIGTQRFFLNPLAGLPGHRVGRAHGAMLDGWVAIGTQWYFFNPARGRAGNVTNIEQGVMREGWVSISNQWFFLNPLSGPGHAGAIPHGVMRDGWVQVGSS